MDSVQISDQNKLLYAGTAATPNYIPPEYYIAPNKDEKQNSSWDDFALGVIFYQVLIGLHPYVVTPCNLAENATNEIYSNITKYLFPFGENKNQIQGYPPIHNNFKNLPEKIQELFVRTFSRNISLRPTAEEWGKSLYEAAKSVGIVRTPHLLGSYVCQVCKRKIEIQENDVIIYDSTRMSVEQKIRLLQNNTYVMNGHTITNLNNCPYDNNIVIPEQLFLEQERQKDIHKEVTPKNDENDNNGCGIIIGIVIFVALIIFLSLL